MVAFPVVGLVLFSVCDVGFFVLGVYCVGGFLEDFV